MPIDLKDIYVSTSEDLLFKIGTMTVANAPPAPPIEITYAGWSRGKLEIVHDTLRKERTLTTKPDSLGGQMSALTPSFALTWPPADACDGGLRWDGAWTCRVRGIARQLRNRVKRHIP